MGTGQTDIFRLYKNRGEQRLGKKYARSRGNKMAESKLLRSWNHPKGILGF
jgi:hypothetical protein